MAELSRRDFIKVGEAAAAAAAIAAIGGPIGAYFYPANLQEQPTEPVLVGAEADLPVGTSKTVPFGRYPALVINTPAGLRAYSAVCTHFACLCVYDPVAKNISCPCHAGYFSAEDGSVISGPPPRPLEALTVEVKDGQVYVGGAA